MLNKLCNFIIFIYVFFDKHIEMAIEFYSEKCWEDFAKEILKIVFTATSIFICTYFSIIFTTNIWEWFIAPRNMLIKIPLVVLGFLATLNYFYTKRTPLKSTKMADRELNDNYTVLRKCLFKALGGIADVIGLVEPTHDGELCPPGHAFHYYKGDVPIFQFFCLRKSDISFDCAKTRTVLQQRLEQMQTAMELPCSSSGGYLYNGRYYCSVLVMDVKESGSYMEITLTWATDQACEQYNQNLTVSIFGRIKSDLDDHDF